MPLPAAAGEARYLLLSGQGGTGQCGKAVPGVPDEGIPRRPARPRTASEEAEMTGPDEEQDDDEAAAQEWNQRVQSNGQEP